MVELNSPVYARGLAPSLKDNGRLQCSCTLTDDDLAVVDAFMREHPEVLFRIYRQYQSEREFAWSQLAKLPSLREAWITVDAGVLNDLSPLAGLPSELISLTLDTLDSSSDKSKDKAKTHTEMLSRLKQLAKLSICGQLKTLDFLDGMTALRTLGLWRCKLKSLAGLERLSALEHLTLHSSGAKDMSPIAGLQNLRSLEIWNQRNMQSLDFLSSLPGLQCLMFVSCGADLDLPDFSNLRSLQVLVLDKLGRPDQLARIAAAPALRCAIFSGSPSLESVDALAPLAGHPTLKEVRIEHYNDDDLLDAISQRYGWKVLFSNYVGYEYVV